VSFNILIQYSMGDDTGLQSISCTGTDNQMQNNFKHTKQM